MTDSTAYVEQALADIEKVKTDAALRAWEDKWTSSTEYLSLPERMVKQLEDAFDAKLRWVWGVGA